MLCKAGGCLKRATLIAEKIEVGGLEQAQRSRTLEIPAVMRALHQTVDDDPKILNDPIAPRLLDPHDDRHWLEPLLNHPFAKQLRGGFVLRSRYAEDCLAEAAARGVRQYLILGAGLDTFAYRQPAPLNSLSIYEVNHPITQEWKRDRLKAANIAIPANLTFAPIDFEKTSLAAGLEAAGFAFDAPTLMPGSAAVSYLGRHRRHVAICPVAAAFERARAELRSPAGSPVGLGGRNGSNCSAARGGDRRTVAVEALCGPA